MTESQDSHVAPKRLLNFVSRTMVNFDRCEFKWLIENFRVFDKTFNNPVYSPTFYTEENKEQLWRVSVYPHGNSSENDGFVSIYINQMKSMKVKVQCKISVVNGKNEKLCTQTICQTFTDTNSNGFHRFARRDFILDRSNALLVNDTLTVLCELETAREGTDVVSLGPFRNKNTIPTTLKNRSDDFLELYNSSKLADFVIKLKDRELKVHKSILAARSTVFSAMFLAEMGESETNSVEITDKDPTVMEEVIRYIYSDTCGQLFKMAADILPIADYYNLESLKEKCVETLTAQLTPDNAVSTLMLADLHNLQQLKEETINFINLHGKEVVNSNGWETLANHPLLAVEAYSTMFGPANTNA